MIIDNIPELKPGNENRNILKNRNLEETNTCKSTNKDYKSYKVIFSRLNLRSYYMIFEVSI